MVTGRRLALTLAVWTTLLGLAQADAPHPDEAAIRRKAQDILSRREYESHADDEDENVIRGVIQSHDGRRLTVIDQGTGEAHPLLVPEGADVTRDGQRCTVNDLKPGDRVKVTTRQDGKSVVKVEAQGPDEIPAWIAYPGAVIGVLVLLLLAVLVWRRARTVFGRERRFGEPDEKEAAERRQRSQRYREEALERARAGDFTEAIRYLFLSLVFLYDESGRVLYQQAYTNREYLSLFDDRPAVRRDLRVFVDLLDDRWYGQQRSSAEHYRECQSLYDELCSQRG